MPKKGDKKPADKLRVRINISLNQSTIDILKKLADEQETNVSQMIERWALEKQAEKDKIEEKKRRAEERERRRQEKIAKELEEQKKQKKTKKTVSKTSK